MKSRECIQKLKEMLSFKLMKKMQGENKDIFPTPPQGKAAKKKQKQLEKADEHSLSTAEKQTSASSEKKSDSKIRSSSQDKSVESTPKISTANKLNLQDQQDSTATKNEVLCLYKYSIGKGNNALMVRSLFKNRFWWMIADKGAEMDRVNFMWT